MEAGTPLFNIGEESGVVMVYPTQYQQGDDEMQ